ncbi:centrosomal protein of 131 kDa-like [Boleophthalmus pectinirostris]|uniref:centrosomal protein of 131 kDa-like n=1 Tax=Boleophthalmus pectinirostris TaxID=150288 RepID=UPI0024322E68|nr:centrosomal protein of 131 kDa-like [Boleophthalmus pectinirostris]
MDRSNTFSSKPWHLYTLEDDARLYDEDFDLEALLCPTPSGGVQKPAETQVSPNIQDSSNPEDRSLVQEPPPLEDSALVRELRLELERTRAQLEDQVQKNFVLDFKFKAEGKMAKEKALELTNALQEKDQQLQEEVRAHKQLQDLYEYKVRENAQLKHQLDNSSEVKGKVNEKELELQKVTATLQKKEKELQDLENIHKKIRVLYNNKVQEHVQLRQEFAHFKKVREKTNKKELELEELKANLLTKEKELENEVSAYKELRCLYNKSAADKVELRQELANIRKVNENLKEKLGELTLESHSACYDVGGDQISKENENLSRRVQELTAQLFSTQEELRLLKLNRDRERSSHPKVIVEQQWRRPRRQQR